ncbi:hypothetical protein BD769DRAFT_1399677 [Suillus cothurnatus]|nr:hypothetical protein BD769DRAFT_1399677 [Suillus cothurnatus]
MVSTRPKNATQHPGEIVKQATRKRRTAKEIAVDTRRTREAQEAQELAAQNGINRVAEVEASMEIEQAAAIAQAKPVKPRPRPVKARPHVTEDAPSKNHSMLGTSFQSKGDHTLESSADNMDADGDCELELESEVRPKKKKKENRLLREAMSAVRLKKQNEKWDRPDDLIKVDQPGRPTDGKAHGLDKKGKNVESKKFSLSGQVNNWQDQVEPHSKGKSSKGASGRSGTSTAPCSTAYSRLTSTSVTSATTFSQATEPPSTPPKSSKYIPQATCSDAEDDAKEYADNDDGEDESDSEERAAVITEKEKGKAAMKTVIEIDSGTDTELLTAPIAGSGKNRTATSAKLTTPSLQESDTNDDTALNLPLSGTPFADLPYERQLEIVSFALEQKPCTGKRKIEDIAGELGLQVEDDSIDYEDGAMEFGDEILEFGDNAMELDSEIEDSSPVAKKDLKGTHSVGRTTTATSVMAVEKALVPQPAKKARSNPATTQTSTTTTKVLRPAKKVKSEPTSTTSTTATVPAVSESMLADMAIKPAAGNGQWRNTDLPPMLTENGSWHRQFVPTVLLWAGSQSSFWTIEAADLLCAVQAIFNTMYPGVKYNVQPRGPIMGVRLCTWRSNFGSTAIALIANFLASLREREDEDEEEDEDENENADSKEKFMTQMAASLLEGYAFLFADPNTCKASEIYCSVFILQMIATTHLNAIAGFIDVPELDTRALSSTKMESVIGACAVALERALKLVAEKEKKSTDLKTPLKINKSTGKESSTPLAFSKLNWGQYTTDYHLSIVKRGPKYTTDTIAMARQFVKDLASDASTKGSLADDSVASSRGERTLLCFFSPSSFPLRISSSTYSTFFDDITLLK